MHKGSFSPSERYGAVKSGIACCVVLLDGSEFAVEVNKKAAGQVVFDHVLRKLEILERDYFGLQYQDEQKTLQWLDLLKPVKKQLKKSFQMFFKVKYFALDPMTLRGSSRNQFYLQLRQEITNGLLFCPPHNMPSILSYILQADIGDYESAEKDTEYMSEERRLPVQSKELESEIAKFHQFHRGMNPQEAVNRFLRLVRDLESYGMHFTDVKYNDLFYQLGLCPSGVAIHKGNRRISFYSWARVMQVCYKNKRFTVRVLGQGPDEGEVNPLNFDLDTVKICKDLWKDTVDTLAFYSDPQKRLQEDPEAAGSSTSRSSHRSSRSSLTSPLSTGYDSRNPPSQASYSPQLGRQPAHKFQDHTYSESGQSDVNPSPDLMSGKPRKAQTLPKRLPSSGGGDPIAQALQLQRNGDGRPGSTTQFSDPSVPTSPEDLTSTSNSEEHISSQADGFHSPLSDEVEQQGGGASPLVQWARTENGVYLEERPEPEKPEPESRWKWAEPEDTGDGRPLVHPEPQDSSHGYPSSSALVPPDNLSQDDMHDSLLDLADALGGSSDSEEGPEEVVNGASANARVERAKPRPELMPGQDGVSSSRPTAERDHSPTSPHSPRLHPSHHHHQPPDDPPPKPPRTNRPAYKTVMKESPILPDRNPLHQQQAKKQNRKLIHHWVQERQLRSFQSSSSQQSLDSNGSSNQERPSPNLRNARQRTPDASPSPLATHRTVAGAARPFGESSSMSTRSDGSTGSLPQLHPSGQQPSSSPVISRSWESPEGAGVTSQVGHMTREQRSRDYHTTDREVPLPDSPAPPPYMSPSPDSEQARLLEQLGRGQKLKPPVPAPKPKPVPVSLSDRAESLDSPDLTSVDQMIVPQVQNPEQVMPDDGKHVSASVTSTSDSSPQSPVKKIHDVPFRTRTPDLIREIEEVMVNQQDPASAAGSLGSLNRRSGSQSPKKPSPENAKRPTTDSVSPGGVNPSMEARHQRRGMERQLRKSQKRFNQLMKSKEGSPGDSDQGESSHSRTGSGSGSGDLRGSGELLASGNFSPSNLDKDPFDIDPRNYLNAPSPVYDKLDDAEMPGGSRYVYPGSSGGHQLEQSSVPPAPHITVGGFEMEDDDDFQAGDGLRNILQEVMSSDNLPPPPAHLVALSQELQGRESQRPESYADPSPSELQPQQQLQQLQQLPAETTSRKSDHPQKGVRSRFSFDPRDLGRATAQTSAATYDPSGLPPEIASFMSRVRKVSSGDDCQEASRPAVTPGSFDSPRQGRRGSSDSTPQASPRVHSFSRGSAEVERSQSMSTYDSPRAIRSRQGNREAEFVMTSRGSPTKQHQHDPYQSLDPSQLQRQQQYQRREEHIPARSYSLPRGQNAAEMSHFKHKKSEKVTPSAVLTRGDQTRGGGHTTDGVETGNMHVRAGSIPTTWAYAQQDVRRVQSFNTTRQVPSPLHPPRPAHFVEEDSIPNSPTYFTQNPPLDRDAVNPSPHTRAVNRSFQDHLNALDSGRHGRKTRVLDWMQRTTDGRSHDSQQYPMMRDHATNQPAAAYLRPSHVYEEPEVALRVEWQHHHQQEHRHHQQEHHHHQQEHHHHQQEHHHHQQEHHHHQQEHHHHQQERHHHRQHQQHHRQQQHHDQRQQHQHQHQEQQQQHQQWQPRQQRTHQDRPRSRSRGGGTAYASHTYAGHEQRQGYPTARVEKEYYVIDV